MYSVEYLLHSRRLMRSGHMFKMPNKRQPKQLLFGVDEKAASCRCFKTICNKFDLFDTKSLLLTST
jgi:hypothetical protein